ncbi:structural maintenance of chromosomes flexible hinge domain-containing protein GMI1-like [Rosa rugosa]|uniref:structural maintenance of chromosomes flexible hinge domain-containing protein GMI1-like n=1 Tax=Rosa rugosa TaxID=74645 RepID=UPI002B40E295|nr:structural maintenance of chromosomes flexible hinge domain-containing protein GMI1-like [Rosa rugosa]XP_062025027.1 structural maintenance of chromosomes flexible hinge domain-containing protein GMI1-like [Rosa rugosa]
MEGPGSVVRELNFLREHVLGFRRTMFMRQLNTFCLKVSKVNLVVRLKFYAGVISCAYSAQFILSSLSDEKGCILSVNEGDTNLDMGESLSVPFSVVDAGKCIDVERTEWENHIKRPRQKSPSSIELLDAEQCQELEVDGIKTLYVGNDFNGDVPLTKKILAALTTGEQAKHGCGC